MTRDEALVKIRKCLALSKSANETEAATALRHAQALMREHGLDDEGVELASVVEVDVRSSFMPVLAWEARLAGLVADAFGCEVISTYKVDRVNILAGIRRDRFWRLIGVSAAPEVAGYTLEVLSRQCVRSRRIYIGQQSKNCKPATKAARGDTFAGGWVCGVAALVERFANGERNIALVAAYMAKTYPSLSSCKPRQRDAGRNVKDAWRDGYAGAANATLNHGVGSPLERKLIEA